MTDWIGVTEAAQLSGYHPEHVRRLIKAGKVKGQKVVTIWQVDRNSLLVYIKIVNKLGSKRGPKHTD